MSIWPDHTMKRERSECLAGLRPCLPQEFQQEINAHVLLHQLNRFGTDLPGALVTRWLTWIRLFDFDIRHIPGIKHTAADGLSRRPKTQSDNDDEEYEVNIDDFIDAELFSISIYPIFARRAPEFDDIYFFRS
jgi:hypothetical protein